VYDIYFFIYHLKNCPFDFLQESKYTNPQKGIDTNALLLDILRGIDSSLISEEQLQDEEQFKGFSSEHLCSLHIAAWFFSLDFFRDKKILASSIKTFLFNELALLSKFVKYNQWLTDEDRTEEFVRSALLHCAIIPDNETPEEARDRLDSLSILKRNNILSESKAAFERIIEIRKAMADKKAREAANVYGRE
jgi:hypothetical protein